MIGGHCGSIIFTAFQWSHFFLIPIKTALSLWMAMKVWGNQASDCNGCNGPCVSEGRSKSGFISVHYC